MKENKFISGDSVLGGIAFSLVTAFYFFLALIVPRLIVSFAPAGSVLYVAISGILSVIALLFAAFVSLKFFSEEKSGLKDVKNSLYLNANFAKPYLGVAAILSFGMFFGLGFLNDSVAGFLKNIGLSVSPVQIPLGSAGEYLLFVFVLCVLPAVAEEIFFRGLILRTFKNIGVICAALISALYFSLYHLSLSQFFYQFIYGFFLAILTVRSGSVYPAIFAHFLNNFAVISFEFFNLANVFYNPLYIAMGIAALAVFCFIAATFDRNKTKTLKGEIAGAFIPYGVFGAAVCLAVIIGNLFL